MSGATFSTAARKLGWEKVRAFLPRAEGGTIEVMVEKCGFN